MRSLLSKYAVTNGFKARERFRKDFPPIYQYLPYTIPPIPNKLFASVNFILMKRINK